MDSLLDKVIFVWSKLYIDGGDCDSAGIVLRISLSTEVNQKLKDLWKLPND